MDHKSKGRTDISDLIGSSVYGINIQRKIDHICSSGNFADFFEVVLSFSAMLDQHTWFPSLTIHS